MPETWYTENEERIKSINDFVEEFRGWQDDAVNISPELKVINIT